MAKEKVKSVTKPIRLSEGDAAFIMEAVKKRARRSPDLFDFSKFARTALLDSAKKTLAEE